MLCSLFDALRSFDGVLELIPDRNASLKAEIMAKSVTSVCQLACSAFKCT
jgi:hypothetical protein